MVNDEEEEVDWNGGGQEPNGRETGEMGGETVKSKAQNGIQYWEVESTLQIDRVDFTLESEETGKTILWPEWNPLCDWIPLFHFPEVDSVALK